MPADRRPALGSQTVEPGDRWRLITKATDRGRGIYTAHTAGKADVPPNMLVKHFWALTVMTTQCSASSKPIRSAAFRKYDPENVQKR